MEANAERKGRGYFTAPNAMIQDRRLSYEARGLLAMMMSFPDSWVFRRSHLMDMGDCGDAKFDRMMGELKAAGYIVETRKRDPQTGRVLGSSWEIVDRPAHV
jgi:hypothetical protein